MVSYHQGRAFVRPKDHLRTRPAASLDQVKLTALRVWARSAPFHQAVSSSNTFNDPPLNGTDYEDGFRVESFGLDVSPTGPTVSGY